MTVNAIDSYVYRDGNGVTTEFPFPFDVDTSSVVNVTLINEDGSTRVLADYEYSVELSIEGGTVTTLMPEPIPSGARLYIWRSTPVAQGVIVGRQTSYDPLIVMGVWDRLTMMMQELAGKLQLTLQLPAGSDNATALEQVFNARAASEAAATLSELAAEAAAMSAAEALAKENSMLRDAGVWTTDHAYAPSDIVTETDSGAAYICQIPHTSDVFSTDLSAGRWRVFVYRGASGEGTGDMLNSENLAELTNVPMARNNLGLGSLATLNPTGDRSENTVLFGDRWDELPSTDVSPSDFVYSDSVSGSGTTALPILFPFKPAALDLWLTFNSGSTSGNNFQVSFTADGGTSWGEWQTVVAVPGGSNAGGGGNWYTLGSGSGFILLPAAGGPAVMHAVLSYGRTGYQAAPMNPLIIDATPTVPADCNGIRFRRSSGNGSHSVTVLTRGRNPD